MQLLYIFAVQLSVLFLHYFAVMHSRYGYNSAVGHSQYMFLSNFAVQYSLQLFNLR
jgi:hypothetical protein